MPINWFVQLLLVIVLTAIAYIIAPKPKLPKPPAATDLEGPTAEAGRPVPVVFGRMRVTGLNLLWYGNISKREYEVDGGGKK